MRVVIDQDPDNENFFSIWTDYPNYVNAELVGKIGDYTIADYLAKCLAEFNWPDNPYESIKA